MISTVRLNGSFKEVAGLGSQNIVIILLNGAILWYSNKAFDIGEWAICGSDWLESFYCTTQMDSLKQNRQYLIR